MVRMVDLSAYRRLIHREWHARLRTASGSETTYHRRWPVWQHISPNQWYDWRWQWQHRLRSIHDLIRTGILPEHDGRLDSTVRRYPMLISPYYAVLMDLKDARDPIRRQAVPDVAESRSTALDPDPLDEARLEAVPGLIHRYPDRALLLVTNVCTTFCRHCFRKRILSRARVPTAVRNLSEIVHYIARHPEIRDVILSGGDPLILPSRVLARILHRLREIPHVEVIRIGTRVPVTLPMRIADPTLLRILDRYSPIWILTHFNHPREITLEAEAAVRLLLRVGAPVLNQTVLLHGINDRVCTMRTLLRRLIRIGVKPYYLHHPDPVDGTAHFRCTLEEGIAIMEGLRGHISGIAIPTYVVDLPGGGGKVPIQPEYIVRRGTDSWILRNHRGEQFLYPNCPERSGHPIVSSAPFPDRRVSVHTKS